MAIEVAKTGNIYHYLFLLFAALSWRLATQEN